MTTPTPLTQAEREEIKARHATDVANGFPEKDVARLFDALESAETDNAALVEYVREIAMCHAEQTKDLENKLRVARALLPSLKGWRTKNAADSITLAQIERGMQEALAETTP